MTGARPLSELFRVKPRFYRSVNIIADYEDPYALTDYILSPLGRTVLRRIADGLKPGSRVRAWSIVGPYGAGKSAFALFLAKVLGYPKDDQGRERLRAVDAGLYAELQRQIPGLEESGFLVVPIVGSREPLAAAILRGLAASLSTGPLARECIGVVKRLSRLARRAERGKSIPTDAFLEAVVEATQAVIGAADRPLGVLIVLDELGKLLEYAALNPAQGDISLLQSLAELGARSVGSPIGLVVILHQAFEHYAAQLSLPQQREWAKVQGRFEEIGFLESPGEMLRLLGEAIEPQRPLDGLDEIAREEVALAGQLGLAPGDLSWLEAEAILRKCVPLHPTVALVLGRLFRSRLAQNERSLFAFLTSGEPYGFQDYLRHESWNRDGYRPFYRLDQLYDYVLTAMGSALYSLPQGKKWAEIEYALERLPKNSPAVDVRVVKAIGLLGLLGDQRHLKASSSVLAYALADGKTTTAEDVHAATQRLCDHGIAIYRQHREAFGLWEGSDIDLDERFQKALEQVSQSASLAVLLQDSGQLRPYLAKRHLYETGTLRYFVPWVMSLDDVAQASERSFGLADGAIVFVVENNGWSMEQTVRAVVELSAQLPSPRRELLLFAIPQETHALKQALEEVAAWKWVAKNTPELEGDSIARKELAGRQMDAENRLQRLCRLYLARTSSHAACVWVHAGRVREFCSAAELSSALSDVCDQVYSAAPIVRNELVNRRTLSSAAAAARRNLIERMLTRSSEPRLGIVGFPPELSMYRSVLESSGLHREHGSGWRFGPPDAQDPSKVAKLWQGIDAFLDSTEHRRRCVSDLLALLRQPPYGIRDGLLPIYLAAALLYWEAETALYENGTFVPRLDIAVFERLIKTPERFDVQRYRLGEARSYLFEQYSAILGGRRSPPEPATLLSAVRPLLAFFHQLPPYTLVTNALSPQAIAVREAVLSAREPHRLLFQDLPKAVGIDVQQVNADPQTAQSFFVALRNALLELQRAYDRLLADVQRELIEAMRLPDELAAARQEAARRAMILQEYVSDLRLKAYVLRLADANLAEREWLESVASCLANKPPRQWNDQDRLRYQIELAELSARFRRVEEVAVVIRGTGKVGNGASVIRLGVTLASGEEDCETISVLPEEAARVSAVAEQMETALRRLGEPARINLAAIAEVVRRIRRSASIEEGDDP